MYRLQVPRGQCSHDVPASPRHEAEERYAILACLLRPRLARALLEHAATAWASFERASSMSPEALGFDRVFVREMEAQSVRLDAARTRNNANASDLAARRKA